MNNLSEIRYSPPFHRSDFFFHYSVQARSIRDIFNGGDQSIFVMNCVASLNMGGGTAFETLDKGEPTLPAASITNGLLYSQ